MTLSGFGQFMKMCLENISRQIRWIKADYTIFLNEYCLNFFNIFYYYKPIHKSLNRQNKNMKKRKDFWGLKLGVYKYLINKPI